MEKDYKVIKRILTEPFKLDETQFIFIVDIQENKISATCANMAVLCLNESDDEFLVYIANDGETYRRFDYHPEPRGSDKTFIFTRNEFENSDLKDDIAAFAKVCYGGDWRKNLLELIRVSGLYSPHNMDAIRNHYSRKQ